VRAPAAKNTKRVAPSTLSAVVSEHIALEALEHEPADEQDQQRHPGAHPDEEPVQLLGEERVAVAALVHPVRDVGIGPAEHLLHQHRGVGAVEAAEGEPPEAAESC